MKKITLLIILSALFYNGHAQDTTKIEYTNIEEALLNPENVYRLNLSNQAINIPESAWSRFINLEYLSLKNDHLLKLPIGITSLSNLKILDLSGNDFTLLPEEFLKLKNLEELYLNDEKNLNLPTTLTTLSKLPKLKSLHLENDNLSLMPTEILKFKKLESLFLNGNKFTEFPKQLDSLKDLKYLEIYQNPLIMNEYKPNGNMIIKF